MRLSSIVALTCTLTALTMATPTVQKLDGKWIFHVDSSRAGLASRWADPTFDRSGWIPVDVPAFWETYPGLKNFDGWGWFATTFTADSASTPLNIYFNGVDDDAEIWVNGEKVGSHTGFSDPFLVDITGAVKKGENLLVVLVKDYAGGGGIYKSVTLVDSLHLDEVWKSPFYGKHARGSAEWVKDAVLYSVYLRSFSKEGTFSGLQKRLPELKNMGHP